MKEDIDNQCNVREPEYIKEWWYFDKTEKKIHMIISGTKKTLWEELQSLDPLKTIAFRSLVELRYSLDENIELWKSCENIDCADIMCWTGNLWYFLHQYFNYHKIFHTLDYVDATMKMLDFVDLHNNSRVIQHDVRELETLNKKYDIITIRFWLNNLTSFTDWGHAINNCLRSLKPGGRLYIIDHFWSGEIANKWFNIIEKLIAELDGRNHMPIFPSSDTMRKSLDEASNVPSMNKKTQEKCIIESWGNHFFAAEFRLYDRIREKNNRWQYDPPLTEDQIQKFVFEAWEKIQKEFGTSNAFISVPWYIVVYQLVRSGVPSWEVEKWFSMR